VCDQPDIASATPTCRARSFNTLFKAGGTFTTPTPEKEKSKAMQTIEGKLMVAIKVRTTHPLIMYSITGICKLIYEKTAPPLIPQGLDIYVNQWQIGKIYEKGKKKGIWKR
jgi:hypothetical protein